MIRYHDPLSELIINMNEMLVPLPWSGTVDAVTDPSVRWLKKLPKNTHCSLWQRWPDHDLPCGHDLYVISFHLEAINKNQARIRISSEIVFPGTY
jgi:hypothetical protein